MQQILEQTYNFNNEDDALLLSNATKIARENIQNSNCFKLFNKFVPNCKQHSVATNIKYLFSMLLNGSSNTDHSGELQNSLSISQAIIFNFIKKSS